MKRIFLSFWFWGILLSIFIALILWEETLGQSVKSEYIRRRMTMTDVNWSQIEEGFEQARMYADFVDMENNRNNMNAKDIRAVFFKEEDENWLGRLISERAVRNPFETKFWGDVRMWNTDNERLRTEELRYFFSRNELNTRRPVTIWKDDMIITGNGLRYNTETKKAEILSDVKIRIWEDNKSSDKNSLATKEHKTKPITHISGVPVAPPPQDILNRPPKVIESKDEANK